MKRLIVVSNRVAFSQDGKPASGGLATGVLDALKEQGGIWFGWNGKIVGGATHLELHQQETVTYATVGLSAQDYQEYYLGFSNKTLWPAFHYRSDLIDYSSQNYAGYQRVNSFLAGQLKKLVHKEDVIWVHDYHLMPFASCLRQLGVNNPIGFFLHIPFPAPNVMRMVPPHRELIQHLCHYDVVGFQTDSDKQAFLDYVTRFAQGVIVDSQHVRVDGRTLKVNVYPIGIQPDEVVQQAAQNSASEFIQQLNKEFQDKKLILGVDRLDYTKGLLERFNAFEAMLTQFPQWQEKTTFMQIAQLTRSEVQVYQHIRQQVEQEVGRINGVFGQLGWTPIQYLESQYPRPFLMAIFRLAQVGFVTPLRDGMNLVAKEYVAAQNPDNPGVLVLSEFAGAAHELSGALIVNPFDAQQMAHALQSALSMPLAERRARHTENFEILARQDSTAWRESFLSDLVQGSNVYWLPQHACATMAQNLQAY